MRNRQIVRQWRILRFLAQGTLNELTFDLAGAAAIFDIDVKTVRRDLTALKAAGFIEQFSALHPPKRYQGPKWTTDEERNDARRAGVAKYWESQRLLKLQLNHTMRVEVKELEKRVRRKNYDNKDEVEAESLMKCNHCRYEFRQNDFGVIDLRDLMAHKRSHVGMQVTV